MHILIHGRPFASNVAAVIQSMFDELKSRNASYSISNIYFQILQEAGINTHTHNVYDPATEKPQADFIFCLGGDGTLLDALTHVGDREIPMLGINTGRLGFLATVSPENLLNDILLFFHGKYEIERRTLVSINGNIPLFEGYNFGLNELGIMKTDTSSMIVIKTFMNDQFLNSYWADGLIVSTPTGSTGYNLSVGGPVVSPGSDVFVISPMSPHNLNVRPFVVPDHFKLRFEIESRSKNFLVSLDSRHKVVDDTTIIHLEKEKFEARLVKIQGSSFIETLRSKLNWGLDMRN